MSWRGKCGGGGPRSAGTDSRAERWAPKEERETGRRRPTERGLGEEGTARPTGQAEPGGTAEVVRVRTFPPGTIPGGGATPGRPATPGWGAATPEAPQRTLPAPAPAAGPPASALTPPESGSASPFSGPGRAPRTGLPPWMEPQAPDPLPDLPSRGLVLRGAWATRPLFSRSLGRRGPRDAESVRAASANHRHELGARGAAAGSVSRAHSGVRPAAPAAGGPGLRWRL